MRVLFSFLILITFSFSFEKVYIGYGFHNGDDVEAYEIGLVKETSYKLFDTLDVSIEMNYTNFEYNTTDDLYIIGITPTLTYTFKNAFYIDGGIGASYVSKTDFENERLGMRFQFRDFIGIGYQFTNDIAVNARFIHYSNAYLDEDNSGLDMGVISLIYRF